MALRIASSAFLERLQALERERPDIGALVHLIGRDFYIEWGHSLGVVADEILRSLVPPLPPMNLRNIAGTPFEALFLISGLRDGREIVEAFERHSVPTDSIVTLDFGCGVGRIMRFIQAVPGYSVVGSDVNPDVVQWCRNNLPSVQTVTNDVDPPLQFPAAHFDLTYAKSIFTHLPEAASKRWIKELARVTKPNGIIILSVNSGALIDLVSAQEEQATRYQLTPEDVSQLTDGSGGSQYFFRRYSTEVIELAKAGENYGTTFVDEAYIRSRWEPAGLAVVEVRRGVLTGLQDLVVLKRLS